MEGKIAESTNYVRDRQRGMNQIRKLGPRKPMGYLPMRTLTNCYLSDVTSEIEHADKSGYMSMVLGPLECDIVSGALFVYDKKSLSDLLRKNTKVLERNGWPTNPEAFVRRVGREQVSRENEVYDIIAAAFGNKNKKT